MPTGLVCMGMVSAEEPIIANLLQDLAGRSIILLAEAFSLCSK